MDETLEKLTHFNEREQDLFSRSLNTLLTDTFILNQLERDKSLYRFTLTHYDVFETYLSYIQWHLRKDENLGIIACRGPARARLSLNLEETLGLLVLRVLYEEKQLEITLSYEKTVKQFEFQEKIKVLSDRVLNKTRFLALLRRFKALKLIAVPGDDSDPESLIILYPSIAFALDGESIDDIHTRITSLQASAQDDEALVEADAGNAGEDE